MQRRWFRHCEVTMSHVPKPVFSHGNVFLVKSVNVLVLIKFDI